MTIKSMMVAMILLLSPLYSAFADTNVSLNDARTNLILKKALLILSKDKDFMDTLNAQYSGEDRVGRLESTESGSYIHLYLPNKIGGTTLSCVETCEFTEFQR